MDNGNASAYPIHVECARTGPWTEYGLTKREEFAKALMAAMMDSYCRQEVDDMTLAKYAEVAVRGADALLAELAKEQPK